MAEHFSLNLGFHPRRSTHIFAGDDGLCPLDYYLTSYEQNLSFTTFREFEVGDRLLVLLFDLDRERNRNWHIPQITLFFKPALVGGVNDHTTPFQVPAAEIAAWGDPEVLGVKPHKTDLPMEKYEGFPIPSKSFGGEFKRFWSTADHGKKDSPWLVCEKPGQFIFGVQVDIFEDESAKEPAGRFIFDPEMHVKTSSGGGGRPTDPQGEPTRSC